MSKNRRLAVSCAHCGVEKLITAYNHARCAQHFCNRECFGKWRSAHHLRENHPRYKRVKVSCGNCGQELLLQPNAVRERNYCNHGCRAKYASRYRRGEAHHQYRAIEVTCSFCGKAKLVKPHYAPRQKRFFCNRSCQGKWMSRHSERGYITFQGGNIEVPCGMCGKIQHYQRCRLQNSKSGLLFCSQKCHGVWKSANVFGRNSPSYVNGYRSTRERTEQQILMDRLQRRISEGIRQSLRRKGESKRGRSWEALVGYSAEQLWRRLQRTMPPGYTWDDFMNGRLHIDHIIPGAVFQFTTPDDHDFKRCWALKNLQLLPSSENIRKHAKLSAPFQPSLI